MSTVRDLQYALRLLRHTPAFTLPAVASLALGIAVNATMFSVVNALLLRPLVESDGGGVVRIGRSMNNDNSFRSVSYDEFEFLERHATSFSDLVGSEIESLSIAASGERKNVSVEIVSRNYFRALKRTPAIGRSFDEQGIDEHSVVVSERFWRRQFGADAAISGRAIEVNNQSFTIIGVAPAGFTGLFPGVATDIWLAAQRQDAARRTDPRGVESMDVVGILNAGVSVATARAELQVLSLAMSDQDPGRDRARRLVIEEARGVHPAFARRIGPFALAMMAIVGVVLSIVCANVASLLLARASARRGEFALRLALGASRRRLITHLLVESGVLAALGAGTGFTLSFWAVRTINALTVTAGPTGAPVFLDLQLDHRVLAFTAALAILTTFVFGLLPAVQGSRIDLMAALKDPQSESTLTQSRWRAALMILQVTVAVVLMVGALLLFRSVRNSTRIDLGFDPDHVAIVSFNLQSLGYEGARAEQFYLELLRRARGLSGLGLAALADFTPMGGRGGTITVVNPRATLGFAPERLPVAYNRVSDDYFVTIGQALIQGRGFTSQDRGGAPRVAIVNETAARLFWPGEDAIGKRLDIVSEPGDPGIAREVVGVANDAKYSSFGADIGPFLFVPALEGFGRLQTLHVRAENPAAVLPHIDKLVREIDGSVVPQSVGTMRDAMSSSLVPARIVQTILGVASAIALLLVTGGLYGLVCYTLEQRFKEIGIRVALGATPGDVFRVIVGSTLVVTAVGVAIGLLLAGAGTRILSSLLVGVSPMDPLTFVSVAILIVAVTLGAGYVAARKGLRADPVTVLKYE